jgi:hypothetical protein
MKFFPTSWFRGASTLAAILAVAGLISATATAADPNQRDRGQLPNPLYRVSERLDKGVASPAENGGAVAEAAPGEHPLTPVLKMAKDAMAEMETNIQDYSATLIKRERLGEKLGENEFMFVKIRQKPFSVYTYFLGPDRMKGQEAIYVEGKNNNCIVGHGVGIRKIAGTVRIDPLGMLAMQGNRYPITEIGLFNLTRRLIEIGEKDAQFGECEVKVVSGAKINGRSCTCIQVTHPVPRKNFLFHVARIFYDDEMRLITRYEAYDWPKQPGGAPQLTEEYTYLNIKINNGFTDADFDENNPAYGY